MVRYWSLGRLAAQVMLPEVILSSPVRVGAPGALVVTVNRSVSSSRLRRTFMMSLRKRLVPRRVRS